MRTIRDGGSLGNAAVRASLPAQPLRFELLLRLLGAKLPIRRGMMPPLAAADLMSALPAILAPLVIRPMLQGLKAFLRHVLRFLVHLIFSTDFYLDMASYKAVICN